jgi:Tol biopolymer transport system component
MTRRRRSLPVGSASGRGRRREAGGSGHGSDLHPILSSDTEPAFGPDFAPNGHKVGVDLSGRGFDAIATIGLAHSKVHEIRRFNSPIGAPVFSPNGRRIAFSHAPGPASDDSEVYVMRADGSHLRRLTHTPGPLCGQRPRRLAAAAAIARGP